MTGVGVLAAAVSATHATAFFEERVVETSCAASQSCPVSAIGIVISWEDEQVVPCSCEIPILAEESIDAVFIFIGLE